MSPRTVDKGRPIDPMSGIKFARKRPEPVSSPMDKADGRQPLMPRVSHNPCPLMLPFRFAHAMRMRPLSVGRVESAFHPAMDYCAIILIVSKGSSEKSTIWLIEVRSIGVHDRCRARYQRYESVEPTRGQTGRPRLASGNGRGNSADGPEAARVRPRGLAWPDDRLICGFHLQFEPLASLEG